ncbi:type I polyketide synthase, partial [Mycobacterium sp. E3198]|uniref:type I polyketide synthase n=1 Tax=Mycobacterium sp. E3198 TaxID=1834143 RepID=UPI0012EA557F
MIESSIPAVLREHASLRPHETAYTFVDYQQDWAGVGESLTWSQLYRRSLNVARELGSRASTGDRVVISAPQGLEYVAAFLGALQAGQIAVPLSEPLGGATDERVSAVLADASPSVILTTSALAGSIADYISAQPAESRPSIVELDLLDLDAEPGPAAEPENPPDIAYLQYTSGSTRTPAGVVISHKNIRANFEQIIAAYYGGSPPPDATVVSWLPFFHDMGLIVGIVLPVLAGLRAVVTSPMFFLQRPARWIQLMASNTRAFSAGPNVAFELAALKTSDDDLAGLDLGDVRHILNGAERVQPSTLRRFAERFARFNLRPDALRPSYGLAETVVFVATRESGHPPEIVSFESEELTAGHAKRCAAGEGMPLVSYGMPPSPMVRIVDPETSIECPAGTVGEIWLHGDNVADGYWQKPEETERTFGATLVGPSAGTPEGPWLRTGDLGFFSDGELFIKGRIKDILIVYGRNHAPDDIEATIQEITHGRCVAIAVANGDGADQLVTIVEVKKRDESEEAAAQRIAAVRRDITAAISKVHGLSVADLVLVQAGSIPLTTSGKVRRRDCVQLYSRDAFTRLDEPISAPKQPKVDAAEADSGLAQRLRTLSRQQHDLLVAEVCSQAAAVLGRPSAQHIDPELTFQDLGFDSVKATELLDRLKTVTELELPLTLAFDYPSPDELATHLSQLLGGSSPAAARAGAHTRVDEPIAVVGMACRFPGGVNSAAALWDLVAGGVDALGEFPADRGWNLADLFDPDPDAVGKTYTRAGGFVADVAGFDADFFGISAREAQTMDPQQRLLLEVCWEALESARIDPAALVGSQTGVFVGAWSQTYGAGGSDGAEGYGLTGSSTSVVSGRVAYALGLQGPAVTVDTACSSSLVATHWAAESLLKGESALALAGGVTVMTTPAIFTEFARQRGLAADGRCKAFSANADGTGWGEGAAVLVLERLSDAQRHHHPVLAVIAGSAINQDGASNGLTAPNGPAQQRVITQAAANAGVALDQVDVVEAHGTGTTLGDPIEAGALIATYGTARDAQHPLWLGSIKSNIGHTQAAAGVAGMIKMIEALNHDTLPPTLHVDRPSPHVDWSAGTVRLLTEAVAWPHTDHPRTAAVSSFGISGTNAHVILQQAPTPEPADATAPAGETGVEFGLLMWPVSARTPTALSAQADRLHQHLAGHPDLDLTDVAYSLATTRTHHSHRAVITAPADSADPRKELLDALDALRAGQPHPQLVSHQCLNQLGGKIVFVLPGQGGQYPGMGRELYEHHPVFAATVDACDEALRPFTDWSVREVLCQDPGAPALDRVDVVQPVLFTMMVSLAEVLRRYGIVPDAVIGHSQGEIAAAYIAGALSLPEAAEVVARRSQALRALGGTGAMASVLLATDELRPRLQPWGEALSIATVNGPSHTIISGTPAAIEEFSAACERDGVHVRSIAVDYASHSAQVEPLRERLLDELADLTPMPSSIPLYSTVGEALSADPLDTTTMDADYWYRNLREPVGFHDRVVERLAVGECTFVELSPHPVLAPAITDALAQATGRSQSAVITTLHRDHPDQDNLATALAHLHNHGHGPSWSALYPHAHTVELPTYPFEHRRYWLNPTSTGDASGLGQDRAEHPLLGAVVDLADQDQVVLTGRLSTATQGWLRGHRVQDTVLFPATGFIDLVLQAGEYTGCPVIDELVLHSPMRLADDTPTDLQLAVQSAEDGGRRAFTVHSRTGGHSGVWTLHASGELSSHQPATPPLLPAPSVQAVDQDDFYDALAQRGYGYSGPFRSLRGIGTDPTQPQVVCAEVALPAGTDVAGYGIHPALLDAALHAMASVSDDSAALRLPYAFSGITLYATAATQLHVRLSRTTDDTYELRATDPTGAPVITIQTITLRELPDIGGQLTAAVGLRDSVFQLSWPALLGDTPAVAAPDWAVVTGSPDRLPAGLHNGSIHSDLATVLPCPELVVWLLHDADEADPLRRVHGLTREVLAQLQGWLARPDAAQSHLVVVTRNAVSVSAFDRVPDAAHAAVWALIHTAQNEHPGR